MTADDCEDSLQEALRRIAALQGDNRRLRELVELIAHSPEALNHMRTDHLHLIAEALEEMDRR